MDGRVVHYVFYLLESELRIKMPVFMGFLWGLYDLLTVIVIIFTKIESYYRALDSKRPRKIWKGESLLIVGEEEVGCPLNLAEHGGPRELKF